MARNRIATATNGDDEESNNGIEGLSGGISKACYFIFIFFWFSLAANFKTKNANRK
jgi:hypothetical protein